MPFKSEAQRRYFHVMQAQGKISPETVKKWEDETPKKKKKKLPYHVGEVKKTSSELEKIAAAVRGKLVGKADASARQYSLREREDGSMTCTCGDYKFRQAAVGGQCKHIKAHKASKGNGTPFLRESVKQAASINQLGEGVKRLGLLRVPKRLMEPIGNPGREIFKGPASVTTVAQSKAMDRLQGVPSAVTPNETRQLGKIFTPKGGTTQSMARLNPSIAPELPRAAAGRKALDTYFGMHEGTGAQPLPRARERRRLDERTQHACSRDRPRFR
jgi:hypothetical protein